MPTNNGDILTEDIVVNYKKADRDDCLHFLTHVDPTCKDLSLYVSPTAKRIYTSAVNKWLLKMHFNVDHIDVQGFETNKSYKITFKGNKYIYSFIDSKFTTGSVALLLHGAFGTYLYTGNFCYYPSFLKSPVLLPVIEEKALTRLYLDNTYYEQPSNFLGFNDLAFQVADLIKSHPMKNFYIYADKLTMDPLIAEIASYLEEKVYICQSTMETMKILGYESFFTRNSNESRIFVDKAFIKKRGFGHENIAVYLNRYPESCKTFQKLEKKRNVYSVNFYAHSNHKEICEMLRILKPESTTFLFSEIDKSKLSYDFKFKYDFPKTFQFNGVLAKSTIKVDGETNSFVKTVPSQLVESVDLSKNVYIQKSIYSENQDKKPVQSASENKVLTKEYVGPLRIRKVPEINNAGLCMKSDENVTCNNELPYYSSSVMCNSGTNTSNFNPQSHSSLDSFHNYHKPQPSKSVDFIKLGNHDSVNEKLISSNIKSLSSYFVKSNTGGRSLVFDPRLVKENKMNGIKETFHLKPKFPGVNEQQFIKFSPNDIQNTKCSYKIVKNKKDLVAKNAISLVKYKTPDSNSTTKQPSALLQPSSNVLNLNKLFDRWMDKNVITILNNPQTSQSIKHEPEKSSSVESHSCDKDRSQLDIDVPKNVARIVSENEARIVPENEARIVPENEARIVPENEARIVPENEVRIVPEDENRITDSLEDSLDLRTECDINQPVETPAEFQQQVNQPTCTEKQSEDNSTGTTIEKSIINDEDNNENGSKLTVPSDAMNENIKKDSGNEVCENNCQDTNKDTFNIISKRRLSHDENKQCSKKLRSDSFRQSLQSHSNSQEEPASLRKCIVLVVKNRFEKRYFYSSQNNCYLPKFFGFKKNEIRPRNMVISLRNLQKIL